MKQKLLILFLILCVGIISCSKKESFNDGYYFSIDEPYILISISNDTMIFENVLCTDTFTYKHQKHNIVILSPINNIGSVINLQYNLHPNGFELLQGDTLFRFVRTPFDNATDFYLDSKGYQFNIAKLENPQYITHQNLIVNLFVEIENDSCKLIINEKQTELASLKSDFQTALSNFEEFEHPLVVLRLFVDKDVEINKLEPILKQTIGLFRKIAFAVKPSYINHSRSKSYYYSFFDYVFFVNDSVHLQFKDKSYVSINSKNYANTDSFKNEIKNNLNHAEYAFIKFQMTKGMSIQEYIKSKNLVYSIIDSLREDYSIKSYGCSFDEVENEIERRKIIEKFPRLVINECEN